MIPETQMIKATKSLGANFSNLLVLQDNFSHAEIEHGADVEDEEEGAHHGQRQHAGPGGAGVGLGDLGAEHLLTPPWPRHRVQLEVRLCKGGSV